MVKQLDELVERRVLDALEEVRDPEIPPVSIVDLGIVERVAVTDDEVEIDLLPTFVGCPALDVIREDVERAVGAVVGTRAVRARFVYSPPWTSDRITERGRESLRSYGLTPPGSHATPFIPLASLTRDSGGAACPFCGSTETTMESAFGPTLCRSTYFCRTCRNPFEAFKAKTPA